MALAQCPECKGNVSTAAAACPHCGHPLGNQAPGVHIEKRLGALGVVLLVLGCIGLVSAAYLASLKLYAPAVVDAGIGACLAWLAWNTGAIKLPCPSCRQPIGARLKAGRATCAKCGHQVQFAPQ